MAKDKGISMAQVREARLGSHFSPDSPTLHPPQVALAWSLSCDVVTAPIVGSTSLDNLKELIGR